MREVARKNAGTSDHFEFDDYNLIIYSALARQAFIGFLLMLFQTDIWQDLGLSLKIV